MAAELPRPGVEVIQVFRSVSPTVVTPTLVPCVVGVCKQIVDVVVPTGAGGSELNASARISLPAFFEAAAATGSPLAYSGLDGDQLVISVTNGPDITITFSGDSLSPASVVAQINDYFAENGVTEVLAELSPDGESFLMRTISLGEFSTLTVGTATSGDVLSAFGLTAGYTYVGASAYGQYEEKIPLLAFPDPRSNLSELSIEADSVRAFLALGSGSSLRELSRTSSFLRAGGGGTAATLVGLQSLSDVALYGVGGTLDGTSLSITLDGGSAVTVTFSAPANGTDVVNAINAALGGTYAADNTVLTLTSATLGTTSSVEVSDTGASVLGLPPSAQGTAGVVVVDDGNGDALSPLLQFVGEDFTAAGTAASVVGTTDMNLLAYPLPALTLTLSVDGKQPQTLTFAAPANYSDVINQILAFWPGVLNVFLSGNFLALTTMSVGSDASIKVVGGTAVAAFGLTAGTATGDGHPPVSGDSLYVDGRLVGKITAVAPGGDVAALKIDKQLPINADYGSYFYVVANKLSGTSATRPTPELSVTSAGVPTVKAYVLRDTLGQPVDSMAPVYLSYSALREDVTAQAKNPSLLSFGSTSDLGANLAPVNPLNPLALGMYFALLNAPGAEVTGLGVDEASPNAPYGTVEGFTRAAEALEQYEVYALAPLTHDETVAQVFSTHVTAMSSPESKGERICLFNFKRPDKKLDALVASGLEGNGVSPTQFDTGVVNLSALVLDSGVSPVGTIPAGEGLFLTVASSSKSYSISSIAGGVVTLRTSFSAGENDDGFYSTDDLSQLDVSPLIDEPFNVKVRGAKLVQPNGSPDKQAIAETYQGLAQSYANRRFWAVMPDTCAATVGGLEQQLEGFYMCAAIAGMIGQQPPQQSFTNFPMTGFTRAVGSNDFFTEKQLNVIAAGGNYIVGQDAKSAPLTARMALTTDMTSIETRTDSITKVVDFTAKFMRRGLRSYIGRYNITQGFLDSLGHVVQGLLGFLTEIGVLIGAQLNNVVQDEAAPDTVLIDVTLDVPFPCNYIRLTLVI